MKALSLWQPWATLLVIGAKEWETRGWYMKYRGPLAIHAAKYMHREIEELCNTQEHIKGILEPRGLSYATLPRGVILGTGIVKECRRAEEVRGLLSAMERAFGDFDGADRFATRFADVVPFQFPIPARGAQGFFEWASNDVNQLDLFSE